MAKVAKGGKRSHKDRPKRVRYRTEKRWRLNGIIKLKRHLKKYGDKDKQAVEALERLEKGYGEKNEKVR